MNEPAISRTRRLRYRHLEDLGFGSRYTVWRKVRRGIFIQPTLDECGNPFWTEQELIEQNEALRHAQEEAAE